MVASILATKLPVQPRWWGLSSYPRKIGKVFFSLSLDLGTFQMAWNSRERRRQFRGIGPPRPSPKGSGGSISVLVPA